TTVYLTPLLFSLNATPPSQIYTLSLHDALPISFKRVLAMDAGFLLPEGSDPVSMAAYQAAQQSMHGKRPLAVSHVPPGEVAKKRSEEHTSELQSPCNLVCRLLLEKKKEMTIGNR